MNEILFEKATQLGVALQSAGLVAATAESCTGGMVAAAITDVAGSSEWFDRGFVTYSNQAKIEMLGVREATLAAHGAVSEQTVREMAAGAVARSAAALSVAISGIAGPGGGTAARPVGLVWFAWAHGEQLRSEQRIFKGDRASVRQQAASLALDGLLEMAAEGACDA